jgi:hypothetical protein
VEHLTQPLNRNLALTESYFDPSIPKAIENVSNVHFRDISNQLEDFASAQLRRDQNSGSKIDVSPDLVLKTAALNEKMSMAGHEIYNINAAMIASLRRRQQALLKPKKPREPALRGSSLAKGRAQLPRHRFERATELWILFFFGGQVTE